MKKLVLIDSHAIIHRAFHALPPLTSPDGTPTNAVYGFTSILLKALKDLKPDYVAATFDHAGPTFRHIAFERYKATRLKAPDELYQQIPLVKEVLQAFGIPVFEKQGYEADDIIGTIAHSVHTKHHSVEIIIITGDLDTLQLIDTRTKVFTMRKGITDTALYDASMVRERYGISPKQLIDFKGLRGDPSDNIPGVKGIGEKTASELLKAYGNIEELYRALKKNKLQARPAVITALKTHEADALFSKTLATIDTKVPIVFVLESARLRKSGIQESARGLFERLGFFSLLRRMGGGGARPETGARKDSSSVRAKSLASLPAAPKHGHSILFKDPEGTHLFIATAADRVVKVPAAILDSKEAQSWFVGRSDVYVWDVKPLLAYPVPADPRVVRDLMILWWLLDPGRRSYQPDVLIAKELQGRTASDAAEIASSLFECAPLVEKHISDEELASVYDKFEAPLIPILYRMESYGIGFNPKPLALLSKTMADELADLEKRIHAGAGKTFNINSPRQLAEVLFETLKLAPKGIRKTEKLGVISTRESELIKLRHLNPIVDDVLRWREIAKLKSTFVDTLPELKGSGSRIRTTWNQTGTATGRLSSQNPNLQNIPIRSEFGRAIRSAFVASPKYELVAFDYSQLELRIAADLAKDEKMIEAFTTGIDIHTLTASAVNHIPIDAVTPELRYRAKALNFGILYGMGTRAFAESAGISRDEAHVFMEEYFRNFRGISRFIEETKEFARTHGYTKTAFGHKRFFPELASTNFRFQRDAERQAVNHPIQGTAAGIMKRAMIESDHFIEAQGLRESVRLLLQIHDELLFEVKKSEASVVAPKLAHIMEYVWQGAVPMAVTVKRGKNWGELE